MKIQLSEREAEILTDIANNYVNNGGMLFEGLEFEIPEKDAEEFLDALSPIIIQAERMDPLLNSGIVKNGISLLAGVPVDNSPYSFKEKITQFLVRCTEHKIRTKLQNRDNVVYFRQTN